MKNIVVIGVGYVGLPMAASFADFGNRVTCVDINAARIEGLKAGVMPIYEPGLEELTRRNTVAGRLRFTTSYAEALNDPATPADMVFICVGTPSGVDGEADLRYVRAAAEAIAETADHPLIIINKSTVPVGTGDWVSDIVRGKQPRPIPFAVVSNPEFLREGAAVSDFINPDRVVLGSLDPDAAQQVAQLYLPLRAPIVVTDLRTAEMIKYASNAFLATKISFINEIANICEALGADVKEVAAGMGYDKRIGRAFLDAGLGYGGSCFEGSETVFALNSPAIKTDTFSHLFEKAGPAAQGDVVEVAVPEHQRVLAFDLDSGRPTLAEVKALTRRPYRGRMVDIITSMGRTLRVTADHPVVVKTAEGFETIPAMAVAPGDQLLALMQLPPANAPTQLNLIELLSGTGLADDVYVAPTDDAFRSQYARFAAHIPTEMLKWPHEIKRFNRMSLTLFRLLREKGVLDVRDETLQLYTAKGAGARINAVIDVDADFMRLCGYYVAEGFISRDTGRTGAVRERVGFRFRQDERGHIDDVRRILSRWGLKHIERIAAHANTTLVSSRILGWLIRDVLGCGTRSEEKALPRFGLNADEALRFELARGAFSGDGAVTLLQDGKNLMLEYATVSKSLADGMTLLLQSLGVIPSARTRMMNRSKIPAHILRISGYAQLVATRDLFGARQRAQIDDVLGGYQRHIAQRGFGRHGAVASLTVMAVHYEEVDTQVYSLETSTGTLIASSGLVCHNCFPKDVKALAHMANVQGKHPQLLESVMQINADQRRSIARKVRAMIGSDEGEAPLAQRTVGVLGLTFKANTDDIRESQPIEIVQILQGEGALVKAYDPVAMEHAGKVLRDVKMCEDAYEVAEGCDALVLATEWNEFKNLDLRRIKASMKTPVLVDGRNMYDPEVMRRLGFLYRGVGRGYADAES